MTVVFRTARSLGWLVLKFAAISILGSGSVVFAQNAASPYTSAVRHDSVGRIVGAISPDPDGGGSLKFLASRTTYDPAGRPVLVESGTLDSWQVTEILPSAWVGFTVLNSEETVFDGLNQKIKTITRGSNQAITNVVQYSYDAVGRLDCTAVRMNPLAFTNLPTSACTLSAAGSHGSDRITKNHYDAAGQLLRVQKALGTPLVQDYVTYTYTANGQQKTVKDANGNLATYEYDGYDRLVAWRMPSAANGTVTANCYIGTISEVNGITGPADARGASDDCEKYSYDRNGNRARLVKRDGTVLAYSYDALNRMTLKDVDATNQRLSLLPTHKRDVHYGYDLRGLQLYARFDSATGQGVTTSYDGFGRTRTTSLNMDGVTRTLTYTRNKSGTRSKFDWFDGSRTSYDYDGLDRLTRIIQGGYVADFNMLGYSYNNRGMKATQSVRYGPVGSTISLSSFTPDNAGRLAAITHDVVGTAGDVTFGLDAYNPASQVTQRSTSNDAYVWTGAYNVSRDYAVNGLNQYTSAGPATFSYDANGNLTGDGTNSYVYDVENRLVSASGASTASLRYDPLGRLYETGGATGLTRFLHDGDELVAEFDGNTNALLRRYLHGVSVDDPVVAYEGAAFNQPRWLHTNHQGSVVAISDSSGAVTAKNTFDDWGIPGSSNASIAAGGRFSYTGQAWIPELGMYYYKARIYSPTLGRFMQTDPVGYKDQMNLYGYVGNDPVNKVDPDGLETCVNNGDGTQTCSSKGTILDNFALALRAAYEWTAYQTGLPSMTPIIVEGRRRSCGVLCWLGLNNESAEIAKEDTKKGTDVISGGKKPAKGGKEIDNTEDDRSVRGVLGEAAEAAGVEVGKTKDGKPMVNFPDGTKAVGYPTSTSGGQPSITIQRGSRVIVKTREREF